MRKEELLQIKKDIVAKKQQQHYEQLVFLKFEESELKRFSVEQLETMCEIINRTVKKVKDTECFVGLSAEEVMQKSTGKVAFFEENGTVREEPEEEVLTSAAAWVYREAVSRLRKTGERKRK